MGLFTSPIKSLDDLFVHTLQDMYYAENQIVKNLPTMSDKASSQQLKTAFNSHLNETKAHVQRLEKVFAMHNEQPKGVTCQAIDGIVAEAKDVLSDCDDPSVCDAALISSAQAVEHYEITRYGTLIALARQLGRTDCASVLEETLQEEKATDRKLTDLAEGQINRQAA